MIAEALRETTPHVGQPDPLLTANIYCAGRLDQVMSQVVAPFWRGHFQLQPEPETWFWVLRYARGGEHLKIRVHTREERLAELRAGLAGLANAFLAGQEPAPTTASAPAQPAPAMDGEDGAPEGHPDCSLLWTAYRRSSIVLGGSPLLDDDPYVTLLTTCLGRGCERVLEAFPPGLAGKVPHARRQAILLQAVSSGLAAALPDAAEREAYLTYHRDWLVRFPILRARTGLGRAQEILARYDREVESMGEATLASLQAAAGSSDSDGLRVTTLPGALAALRAYLQPLRQIPRYRMDPFVPGPVFPALFRALHGIANQLGLTPLNEGLAYHLLLRASAPAGRRAQFFLVPTGAASVPSPEPAAKKERAERAAAPPEPDFDFEKNYEWWTLIGALGPSGQSWVERFRADGRLLLGDFRQGLKLLRQRQLKEGFELLRRTEEGRQLLAAVSPGAFHLLGRFYYGALAYYHYCVNDFDLAASTMQRAHDSIRDAVDAERHLLPFVAIAPDIPLKQAQVARARSRWWEMREILDALREVIADREPLCVLADGTAVYHRTIGEAVTSHSNLSMDGSLGLRYLLDQDLRLRTFERWVENLYAIPGALIPYPG